jgi:hypothetical protein
MHKRPQQTALLQKQLQPASHLQQQASSKQAALQTARRELQQRQLLLLVVVLVQAVQRTACWTMLCSCWLA